MTPILYIRSAVIEDLDTLVRWRRETAQWLVQSKKTDQWASDYPQEKLIAWINAGETVMVSLSPGGVPVATVTVSPSGDPQPDIRRTRGASAIHLQSPRFGPYAGRNIGNV
jgi:hypothetical protein